MSTVIRAERARVWRALTEPKEVSAWDTSVIAALDAPPDYPQPGQHVRWRARLGEVPMILHDRPLEVVREAKLRAKIELGLFRFDETYTLAPAEPDTDGAPRTRLAMRLVAANSLPVVGGVLEPTAVTKLATGLVDGALKALRAWCEAHP
jgi:uncharacterized protein YndB with AHSA1/START domain